MNYWSVEKDGSLRIIKLHDQAYEYILRRPLTYEKTVEALTTLTKLLNKPGTKVYDSYRTSIHVHINCMYETIRTVVNYITLATIFDELFVSQNGQTRIGNNFCLRTRDAEGQIAELINSINKYGTPWSINPNSRYSSVNMASLCKFGTIEFRSLECTTDLDRILHWIKTLQTLKVAARLYRNPTEIIADFSRKGPLNFTISNLGEQHTKYTQIPLYHEMLYSGMRLAQDFAFCSEWVTPEPLKVKDSLAKKWLDDMGLYPQELVPAVQPPPQVMPLPNEWLVGDGDDDGVNLEWLEDEEDDDDEV